VSSFPLLVFMFRATPKSFNMISNSLCFVINPPTNRMIDSKINVTFVFIDQYIRASSLIIVVPNKILSLIIGREFILTCLVLQQKILLSNRGRIHQKPIVPVKICRLTFPFFTNKVLST
jgi:hypothetical protein